MLLPPPRGNTAARPPIHYCPWGLKCFVFIDLCDICNIDMRNCLGDSVFAILRRYKTIILQPYNAIILYLAFWSQLGPIWWPKVPKMTPRCRLGSPKWPQDAPQDRLGDDQNDKQKEERFPDRFCIIPSKFLGSHLGAQNGQKWYPKRIKNSTDFQEHKNCSPRASWSRLGPILRHFGGHLGVQNNAPVLEFVVFREKSRFWSW